MAESSSSNHFLCNSSTEFVAGNNKLSTITEARLWEEEGKKIQGFWTVQEGEEAITGLLPNSKENQHKTEAIQGFLKIQIESPNQNQVKSQTYLFVLFKNNNEFQNDVEQCESEKFWFRIVNPNFFQKKKLEDSKVYNVDSSL